VSEALDAVVKLAFVRGHGFNSSIISRLTGFFTHVDCEFDDGTLWGARSDRIKPPGATQRLPAGVQPRPPNYEKWEHRTVFAIPCTILQRESYHAFYVSQQGKPYDWLAIINNFGFGYNWRTPDHWFCSDIATASGESADMWGIADDNGARKLFVPTYGTSPGMLAMLVSGCAGTQILSSY
jgi:hypothetical protein